MKSDFMVFQTPLSDSKWYELPGGPVQAPWSAR